MSNMHDHGSSWPAQPLADRFVPVLCSNHRFKVPVCPHAGGVGLCELVIHLSIIDYVAV